MNDKKTKQNILINFEVTNYYEYYCSIINKLLNFEKNVAHDYAFNGQIHSPTC